MGLFYYIKVKIKKSKTEENIPLIRKLRVATD